MKKNVIAMSLIAVTMLLAVPLASILSDNFGQDMNGRDGYGVNGITLGAGFEPVVNIYGVPTAAEIDVPLTLTGSVTPGSATNQTIVWSLKDAGTTRATLSGSTLTARDSGTIVVTATVANGVSDATDWAAVSAGTNHTVALKTDGTLWAWGNNFYGQLGNGMSGAGADENTPIQIGTDTDWATVSAGNGYTVAIKTNGTLYAWGYNFYGQLGLGDNSDRDVPTQIGAAVDWAAVSAGGDHTVAVKTDDTLWTWGRNNCGQLGDGTSGTGTNKNAPAQIGSNDWAAASAGGNHTVAVKTDGTLWAWGLNGNGQLGNGKNGAGTNENVPVQVGTDADWATVSAGKDHTVAIKTGGTLWAWGWNYRGQLGDGTTDDKNAPVQIGTDTDWATVSAGYDHTVAIKTGQSLYAWGRNYDGQMGNGTNIDRNTPVRIGSANDWATVSAGHGYTAGVRTTHTIWTWGSNDSGKLGDSSAGTSVPRMIGTYAKDFTITVNARGGPVTPGSTGGGDDSDSTLLIIVAVIAVAAIAIAAVYILRKRRQ